MNNELYHHGILGMKWGVRRFQNEDGSLTAAGRKRYDVGVEAAKERVKAAQTDLQKAKVAYNSSLFPTKQVTDALNKAQDKADWEMDKLSSEKIRSRQKFNNGKKSKHRLNLEQHYLEKGMSREEAEIAAYKRVRTEKMLAAVGGITVTSVAAYVAYKQYDKTVDKLIKPGAVLQNISTDSNKGVSDAFYFSMTKNDNNRYRGYYGKDLKNTFGVPVYETKIGVKSGLKVASEKSATKALSEMISNDPQSADALKRRLSSFAANLDSTDAQRSALNKGLSSLQKGKIDSRVYNAFNIALANNHSTKLNQDFYNILKSKGFDAIIDVNDKKYSGYESSKPMIAFNAGTKTVVSSIKQLGDKDISNAEIKAFAVDGAKAMATSLGTLVPITAGVVGLGTGFKTIKTSKKRDSIVSDYRKEHPNTKLSYNEIVDRYYNKQP